MSYRIFLFTLLSLNLSLYSGKTNADSHQTVPDNFLLVGQSSFSVWFWDIYDIQLKSQNGLYARGQVPIYLELTYQRKINKVELIEETDNQWKRYKLDETKKQNWLSQLHVIWPDVKENDAIGFYINKNQSTDFYFNQRYIGSINDAEFSQAFALIWLDIGGPYPDMTKELLGQLKD